MAFRSSEKVEEKNCRALRASTGVVFTGLNAKEVRTWRLTRKSSMVTIVQRCQWRCDEDLGEL